MRVRDENTKLNQVDRMSENGREVEKQKESRVSDGGQQVIRVENVPGHLMR